jgi:hypothetical protein
LNKRLEEVVAVLERGNTFLLISPTVLNVGMECGIVLTVKVISVVLMQNMELKACTNHAVKEQELTEIILDDLKNMSNSLDHPKLESKIEKKVKATAKKNESRLETIERQVQKQIELKRNSLQKFISENISKQDYDDYVCMVQEKLQQLELEKVEIKKRDGRKSRNKQNLCHHRTTQRVFTVQQVNIRDVTTFR